MDTNFNEEEQELFEYYTCHYIAEGMVDSFMKPKYERPVFYYGNSSFTIPYNTEIRLEIWDDEFSLYN